MFKFTTRLLLILTLLVFSLADSSFAAAYDEEGVNREQQVLSSDIVPEQTAQRPDYVKQNVTGFFAAICGHAGDVVVAFSIAGIVFMLYRRKYKAAVGFLILICGIVIIRVIISFLFGKL